MPATLTPEAQAKKDAHNRAVDQRIECEKTVIRSFVHHILADSRGFTISVCDGEAWPIKQSRDKEAIIAATYSTDSDTLRVRYPRKAGETLGESFGFVTFVYGNAGYEVAADCTDTEEFNALIAPALQTMGNQKH